MSPSDPAEREPGTATTAADPRPEDRAPVDDLVIGRRPDARTADGDVVSSRELEAAGELSRLGRRLGLESARIDGFGLYRIYSGYRDLRERAAGLSATVRSRLAGRREE